MYLRFSSVAESGQHIWTTFAPVLIGGLLLLYLVQVPMAWSMARTLQQGQQERERLLQRAIDAFASKSSRSMIWATVVPRTSTDTWATAARVQPGAEHFPMTDTADAMHPSWAPDVTLTRILAASRQ